jgi:hypothetical protein
LSFGHLDLNRHSSFGFRHFAVSFHLGRFAGDFADVFGVGDAADADAGGVEGVVAGEDFVPFFLVFDGDEFAPDVGATGVELGVLDGDFAHLAGGEFFAVDVDGELEMFEEGVALFMDGGGRRIR